MKKALSVFALGLAFLLFAQVGSAFAETRLNAVIGEVMGTPYKYAGTTASGFDCSGFTMYVFAKFGIELPHSSKGQAGEGKSVEKSDLRPGDLVFFTTDGTGGISHVGIYVGDNKFVHSASDEGVVKNDLDEKYYKSRYKGAARVFSDEAYELVMQEAKKK